MVKPIFAQRDLRSVASIYQHTRVCTCTAKTYTIYTIFWLIVKEIKKRNTFFSSFYKVCTVNPTHIESRDQKKFTGSGIKFCNDFGARDQNLRPKCGISWQKIYLVTTLLTCSARAWASIILEILSFYHSFMSYNFRKSIIKWVFWAIC